MDSAPTPTLPAVQSAGAIDRTGSRRFWTGREEKILRNHFPTGGLKACQALLPGRSSSSIYNRAHHLGLSSPAGGYDRQTWETSPQIDDFIRRTYQSTPRKGAIADCARIIGRPRWWVSKRAETLGLKYPRFKEANWTEAELELVAERAHQHLATIQRALEKAGFKRTETAIMVKLKRLGLSREDPDHFAATGLAKLLGVDAKTVIGWIQKGGLKAKKRGTERTAAQGGDEWWIHRRDVRAFVAQNVQAVDLRKIADKHWFIDLLVGGR